MTLTNFFIGFVFSHVHYLRYNLKCQNDETFSFILCKYLCYPLNEISVQPLSKKTYSSNTQTQRGSLFTRQIAARPQTFFKQTKGSSLCRVNNISLKPYKRRNKKKSKQQLELIERTILTYYRTQRSERAPYVYYGD